MVQPIESRLVYQDTTGTALGRVSMAAFLKESRGTGWDTMRVLGSYALVYLLEGGGRYTDAAGFDAAVSAGDLLLVYPEIPHRYGPAEGKKGHWNEFYILFDGPVFDLWRQRGLWGEAGKENKVLRLEPPGYWRGRWSGVFTGLGPGGEPEALEVVCRVQAALAEALAHARQQATPEQDRAWLGQAGMLLEKLGPGEARDVRKVARQMGMGYESFRKRFVQLAGLPPGRWITTRRMGRACELMARGTMTNRALAAACGFCDEFHFSRRFKQVMGMSPAAFRRQLPGG